MKVAVNGPYWKFSSKWISSGNPVNSSALCLQQYLEWLKIAGAADKLKDKAAIQPLKADIQRDLGWLQKSVDTELMKF